MNRPERDRPIRNMLSESYPKDTQVCLVKSAGSESTEYRRAFNTGRQDVERPNHAAGALSGPIELPMSHRRRVSGKNLFQSEIVLTEQKTDWTTSYMRDFRQSSVPAREGEMTRGHDSGKGPVPSKSVREIRVAPGDVVKREIRAERGRDSTDQVYGAGKRDSTDQIRGAGQRDPNDQIRGAGQRDSTDQVRGAGQRGPTDEIRVAGGGGDSTTDEIRAAEKNEPTNEIHVKTETSMSTMMAANDAKVEPGIVAMTPEQKTASVTSTSRNKSVDRGDSMKTIMRHSNFLPNPIPTNRRLFDDDENSNPSLKNFINSISRK